MDFVQTMMEIGICESAACVSASGCGPASAQAWDWMPEASAEEARLHARLIARDLSEGGWENLLLLSPEVMVLEELARAGFPGNLFLCLSRELDEDSCTRIGLNVPEPLAVSCIREGEYPPGFRPPASAVVAFGLRSGSNAVVPGYEYRQLACYRGFTGDVVLAVVAEGSTGERPLGWYSKALRSIFSSVIG